MPLTPTSPPTPPLSFLSGPQLAFEFIGYSMHSVLYIKPPKTGSL